MHVLCGLVNLLLLLRALLGNKGALLSSDTFLNYIAPLNMGQLVEAAFRVQLVNVSVLPVSAPHVIVLIVVRSLELNLNHFIEHLFDN